MAAGGGGRRRTAAARGRRLRRWPTCHVREVRVSMGTRRMAGRVGSRQGRAHLWWEGGGGVIGTRSLAPPAPWATRGRPPGPLETLCGKARAATSAGRGGCACRDAGRAHASATWCGACQPQLQSQRTFKGDEGRCTVVRGASWACAHLGEVPGSRSRRTMRLVDLAERFHSKARRAHAQLQFSPAGLCTEGWEDGGEGAPRSRARSARSRPARRTTGLA